MFTLIVRFDLPDAAAAETFDALVAQAVPLIREREEGTLTYLPYRVTDEPLARVFYEVYRDSAAHDEHRSQPHTEEFLTAVGSLVTSVRVEALTEA